MVLVRMRHEAIIDGTIKDQMDKIYAEWKKDFPPSASSYLNLKLSETSFRSPLFWQFKKWMAEQQVGIDEFGNKRILYDMTDGAITLFLLKHA